MTFDPDQLLKSLNRGRDKRTTEFSLKSASRWAKPPVTLASNEEYRNAAAAFRNRLLELVDEWIRSGRKGNVDDPKTRILTPGSGAYLALDRWLHNSRPHEWIAPTGEIRRDLSRPTSRAPETAGNPTEIMQFEAIEEFASLMNSPFKYQIANCGRCSKYYFRKKLRSHYNAEKSYCSDCRRTASATSIMQEKREQKHNKLVEKAVQALKEWPTLSTESRVKHKTENSYIAGKLQKHGVTVKWVTRNIEEIKKCAEENEHASL